MRSGREIAGFWVITVGLCILGGALSYGVGRDWVGRTLGEAISSENVQIKPQEQSGEGTPAPEEQTGPPPAQIKVELEPRAPTEAEKQELTAQQLAEAAARREPEEEPVPTSSSSAAVPPDATTDQTTYEVTAGSFTVPANAERVKRDLEKQGYRPRIVPVERRGTTYHRVVVGTYPDKQKAESVRRELEAAGFVAGVAGG
jgi:cell division protein FtsN